MKVIELMELRARFLQAHVNGFQIGLADEYVAKLETFGHVSKGIPGSAEHLLALVDNAIAGDAKPLPKAKRERVKEEKAPIPEVELPKVEEKLPVVEEKPPVEEGSETKVEEKAPVVEGTSEIKAPVVEAETKAPVVEEKQAPVAKEPAPKKTPKK